MTDFASHFPVSKGLTLLFELNHRINNEFSSAINAISLTAMRTENAEVANALNQVVELLHQFADVHGALKMPERNVMIDAAEYLQKLCRSISRSKLNRMGIKLVLSADTVWLHSERCWQLGMIVYELITNVARHAFFKNRDGEVRVELSRTGAFVRCGVFDNGSTIAGIRPGRGLEIIGELAKGLHARVDRSFGAKGSLFTLVMPFVGKEQRANCRHPSHQIESYRTKGLDHAQQ